MTTRRAALVQLCSGDDPGANLTQTCTLINEAADKGAGFILTPEVTNCVSASRPRQSEVLRPQDEDETLSALRAQAQARGIWLLIGSLALKTDDPDSRFANRSFLISPNGDIAAWYDKIHMFDVRVSEAETYRESAGYRPGDRAVCVDTGYGRIGMSICYDVRFPALYRILAQSGAQILTVPSAFSPVTGQAHWEVLLRSRAIETGSYVLAPAQTGQHLATQGRVRATYGHSLVVGPWGDIIADGGAEPGVILFDIDLNEVAQARRAIPSLMQEGKFDGP